MQPVLPIIRRLPAMFSQLRASLMAWKDMGHGLSPIRYWSTGELDDFLSCLYVATSHRLIAALPRPVTLYRWRINAAAEVCGGPELLMLLGALAAILAQPLPTEAENYLLNLVEQICWSLIGLLYAEEPGESTLEQILASH